MTTVTKNTAQTSAPATFKQPSIFDVLEIVRPHEDEWEYMWHKLQRHPINKGIKEPECACNFGEVWQYMYTEEQSHFFFWKRKYHVFRHRFHPKENCQVNLCIQASESYLA